MSVYPVPLNIIFLNRNMKKKIAQIVLLLLHCFQFYKLMMSALTLNLLKIMLKTIVTIILLFKKYCIMANIQVNKENFVSCKLKIKQ